MIDESDLALVDLDSSNSLVPTIRPNLIVLRTLAESHGWPGLGPSYLVTGNLDLLVFFRKIFLPQFLGGSNKLAWSWVIRSPLSSVRNWLFSVGVLASTAI